MVFCFTSADKAPLSQLEDGGTCSAALGAGGTSWLAQLETALSQSCSGSHPAGARDSLCSCADTFFCQLCVACPRKRIKKPKKQTNQKTRTFRGRQLSSQTSKPFLTALRFSGGHGCVSLLALCKMKILLIYPAEERGFVAQLCKDPVQAGRQSIFL